MESPGWGWDPIAELNALDAGREPNNWEQQAIADMNAYASAHTPIDLTNQATILPRTNGNFGEHPISEPKITFAFDTESFRRNKEKAIQGHIRVIPTHFADLDIALGGGLREGLYMLSAGTGVGKSSTMAELVRRLILKGHVKVVYYTGEMSKWDIESRIVASIAAHLAYEDSRRNYRKRDVLFYEMQNEGWKSRKLPDISLAPTFSAISDGSAYRKELENNQSDYCSEASKIYEEKVAPNLLILESAIAPNTRSDAMAITPAQIEDAVAWIKDNSDATNGVIVIIDYLQILGPYFSDVYEKTRTSDRAVIERTINQLKALANNHNCPIFCLNSINRASYKQAVGLDSGKETGLIEFSANAVIGMNLAGMQKASDPGFNKAEVEKSMRLIDGGAQVSKKIEWSILKNRYGLKGQTITTFLDAAHVIITDERLATGLKGNEELGRYEFNRQNMDAD